MLVTGKYICSCAFGLLNVKIFLVYMHYLLPVRAYTQYDILAQESSSSDAVILKNCTWYYNNWVSYWIPWSNLKFWCVSEWCSFWWTEWFYGIYSHVCAVGVLYTKKYYKLAKHQYWMRHISDWSNPTASFGSGGWFRTCSGRVLCRLFKGCATWRTKKFTDFSPFSMMYPCDSHLWVRHLCHCVPAEFLDTGVSPWTCLSPDGKLVDTWKKR